VRFPKAAFESLREGSGNTREGSGQCGESSRWEAEISAAGGIDCRAFPTIGAKRTPHLLKFLPWHGVC
jgi:hypothetical protein